jgi:bifunctional non-homologous end joining protein LigD
VGRCLRCGNDWTKRFRKIADDAWHISAGSAIVDGEVVVPAENGSTDFSVLQNELKGKSTKIVLVAFDLLYLNGYDLRRLPLIERKAHLKKIIDGTDIQFSESFEVDGPEMYAHACKVGLEGVVSKVRDSRYDSGRSRDWGNCCRSPQAPNASDPQKSALHQAHRPPGHLG